MISTLVAFSMFANSASIFTVRQDPNNETLALRRGDTIRINESSNMEMMGNAHATPELINVEARLLIAARDAGPDDELTIQDPVKRKYMLENNMAKLKKAMKSKEITTLPYNQRLTFLGAVWYEFGENDDLKVVGPWPEPFDRTSDVLAKVRVKNGPLKGREYYIDPFHITTLQPKVEERCFTGIVTYASKDVSILESGMDEGQADEGLERLPVGTPCTLFEKSARYLRIRIQNGRLKGQLFYIKNTNGALLLPDPWLKQFSLVV